MQLSEIMADKRTLAQYVARQKKASANSRQGALEPLLATGNIQTDAAGLIAANTQVQLFIDQLGAAASSGLAQTEADGTLFGGTIAAGQVVLVRGLGFSVHIEPAAATAQDVNLVTYNTSVQLNLRGTNVDMGNMAIWPSHYGARGTGNGNTDNGVTPFVPYVVWEPTQQISVTLRVRRAITLSQVSSNVRIACHMPCVRIFDPSVLGRG